MITKMTGRLVRVLDDEVRLEVGPFEYQLLVPEVVRRQVQMRVGESLTFHVNEYLEGVAGGSRFVPRRLGFLTESELEFFELFCTVEKIGAKKALKAMARPVAEIAAAIARHDTAWLTSLPGIGAATAEQIVATLRRKVAHLARATEPPADPGADSTSPVPPAGKKAGRPTAAAEPAPAAPDPALLDDVEQALVSLGLSPAEARTKLDALLTSRRPFATVEQALTLIYAKPQG